MKKYRVFAILLSVVLVAVLALMTGCLFEEEPSPSTPTSPLLNRVEALENKAVQLDTAIGNISAGGVDAQLRADFDAFVAEEGSASIGITAEIDALAVRIAALELEEEEEEEEEEAAADTSEAIRWRMTASLYDILNYPISLSDLNLTVRADARLKEEGLYYVDLQFYNTGSADLIIPGVYYVMLTLKPSTTSDYALLDEGATYLDTDDATRVSTGVTPSSWVELSWDYDFYTRTREGLELTKKVVFESSHCTDTLIPPGGYVIMPLVLELYYVN